MLDLVSYNYLQAILREGPFERPLLKHGQFSGGFEPVHKRCHLTAAQAAVEFGEPPVIGIEFLDLANKLFPWPHMVNASASGLVDYSPKVDQPILGFIRIGWHRLSEWRNVTRAFNDQADFANAPTWGDELADKLSDEFLPILKTRLF